MDHQQGLSTTGPRQVAGAMIQATHVPSCPQGPPEKEEGPCVPPEFKRDMDSRFLTSPGMGVLPPSLASPHSPGPVPPHPSGPAQGGPP